MEIGREQLRERVLDWWIWVLRSMGEFCPGLPSLWKAVAGNVADMARKFGAARLVIKWSCS